MAISTPKITREQIKDSSVEELVEFASANGVTVPGDEKDQTKKNLTELFDKANLLKSTEEANAEEKAAEDAEAAKEGYPKGARFFVSERHVVNVVTNGRPIGPDGETPSIDGSLVESTQFDAYEERVDGDRVLSGFLATDNKEVIGKLVSEDGTTVPGVVEVDEDEFTKRTDKALRLAS